jgi:hypothetical protein
MSSTDRHNTAANKASLQAARQAIKDLRKDEERMIREAHERLLEEKKGGGEVTGSAPLRSAGASRLKTCDSGHLYVAGHKCSICRGVESKRLRRDNAALRKEVQELRRQNKNLKGAIASGRAF